MFNEETRQLSRFAIAAIVGVILLIAFGGFFTLFALKTQHDLINPQIRQNKIDSPDVTIANKQDFHNKLGEIISADQNVIADINLLQRYSKNDPNYDTALNNLAGVEQIRAQAINAYDAETNNPDTGKDLDPWMPRHIDASNIPSSDTGAINFLNGEISMLQTSYNKGA